VVVRLAGGIRFVEAVPIDATVPAPPHTEVKLVHAPGPQEATQPSPQSGKEVEHVPARISAYESGERIGAGRHVLQATLPERVYAS
jgi:hypothetical protein